MNVEGADSTTRLGQYLSAIQSGGYDLFIKRLASNDTGMTNSHQVGLYIPHDFCERVFPEVYRTDLLRPDLIIERCDFASHATSVEGLRVVYYNEKHHPDLDIRRKHDECRITRWGGRSCPVQDPDATGRIFIFAVKRTACGYVANCWLARSPAEECTIQGWLGTEVEPARFYQPLVGQEEIACAVDLIADEWYESFPTGKAVFEVVAEAVPFRGTTMSADALLLKRRTLEFEIFQEIERAHTQELIKAGFSSIDAFIAAANSVANRRKARAGRSLELHLASVFRSHELEFEEQAVTEVHRKPDFLFPSAVAYHDRSFPRIRLRMLGAKTCCKDRWRQVLSEAREIERKHLFTLDQGISCNQLAEMTDSGLTLVVPQAFHRKYPSAWRQGLLSLEGFISEVKSVQGSGA